MSAFHIEHATPSSRIGSAILIALCVVLATAPLWGGREQLHLLAEFYAYVALASLWNLLAGYAGLVSVGQQAYVGIGAYGLFALAMLAGVHPLFAIPIAGVVAAAISVPTALLLFRLRGHYFAIASWVVAEVFRLLTAQISVLGGGSGTSLPATIVIAMAPSREMREFVIFITVIGGVGRIEGPLIGTVVFFILRQLLADYGTIYLLMLGVVAIAAMLKAPKGLWGLVADRFGWQMVPLERRVVLPGDAKPSSV